MKNFEFKCSKCAIIENIPAETIYHLGGVWYCRLCEDHPRMELLE